MGDLADSIRDLEDAHVELGKEHEEVCKQFDALVHAYDDLMDSHNIIEAELEWYRSTFPEGSDAYACMRRME